MKTKLEILQNMVNSIEEQIITSEIMERYLNQKLILSNSGKGQTEALLGQTQRELKEKRDLRDFLQRALAEEESTK